MNSSPEIRTLSPPVRSTWKPPAALLPLVGVTTLMSAILLFLIQPMVARFVLPWYGGSAAVWTSCMLFFQLVLVLGYLYGDLLVRHFSQRVQLTIHASLIAAAAVTIVASGTHIKPDVVLQAQGPHHPVANILFVLLVSVGLPYFVVSTTGPLLQAWVARVAPHARFYRLYALSNIGSLLALIAYPSVVEPIAANAEQSRGWSLAFLVFAGLMLMIAFVLRSPAAVTDRRFVQRWLADESSVDEPTMALRTAGERYSRWTWWRWVALAALASLMLLAVTAHIGRNVAAVPFLWVVPLVIYLLSFVLCFDSQRWYRRNLFRWAVVVFSILMIIGLEIYLTDSVQLTRGIMPIKQALILYCVGLFVICMFCHGELAAEKPASDPTGFYLAVACGGALGGIIGAVVAPMALPATFELPIGLLIAQMFVAHRVPGWGSRALAGCLAISIVLVAEHVTSTLSSTVAFSRNFYGAISVIDRKLPNGDSWRLLKHGVIAHGAQVTEDPGRATLYFSTSSGVARAMKAARVARGRPLKVGIVGLGAGVLAAYGQPGDQMRFYELDPQVLHAAQQYFSFLANSTATIEHRVGDARLNMASEPAQHFDILVLDAFSGDAVPVHLLTREALRIYRRHLAADGAVLVHITNRYIDLRPAIHALASDAGLKSALAINVPPRDAMGTAEASTWAWIGNPQDFPNDSGFSALDPDTSGFTPRPVWTDDYSDLFGALR